jgi:heme/copper-type cytochrome/quinol oxidase subunit 2
MKLNRLLPIALALVVVLALATAAEACPGCAEAQAGQGPERANIVRGYFWSIVFMMSMPFLMVGGFGTYCYVQFKKLKVNAAAAAQSPAPTSPPAEAPRQTELTPAT